MLLVLLAGDRSFVAAQEAPEGRPAVRYSDEADRPVVELPAVNPDGMVLPEPFLRAGDAANVRYSRVVYHNLVGNSWDIFISDDGGGHLRQLTSGSASEVTPDLKRGGEEIVYVSNEGGDTEIRVMDSDGRNVRVLTNNDSAEARPVWSPDGSRIAFVSDRDGQAEIYTMLPDGSDQRRLTANAAFDGDPAWSPDGSQIVFSSGRTGAYRLFVMDADGRNLRQLTTTPVSIKPTWSPDGQRIAYSADADMDGWLDLHVVNADGSGESVLVNPTGNADAWARSWSPGRPLCRLHSNRLRQLPGQLVHPVNSHAKAASGRIVRRGRYTVQWLPV